MNFAFDFSFSCCATHPFGFFAFSIAFITAEYHQRWRVDLFRFLFAWLCHTLTSCFLWVYARINMLNSINLRLLLLIYCLFRWHFDLFLIDGLICLLIVALLRLDFNVFLDWCQICLTLLILRGMLWIFIILIWLLWVITKIWNELQVAYLSFLRICLSLKFAVSIVFLLQSYSN